MNDENVFVILKFENKYLKHFEGFSVRPWLCECSTQYGSICHHYKWGTQEPLARERLNIFLKMIDAKLDIKFF